MAKYGLFKGDNPNPVQAIEGDYMLFEKDYAFNVYKKVPPKSEEGKTFGEVGFGEVMHHQPEKLVGAFKLAPGETWTVKEID
jgi:hypothetical protein